MEKIGGLVQFFEADRYQSKNLYSRSLFLETKARYAIKLTLLNYRGSDKKQASHLSTGLTE